MVAFLQWLNNLVWGIPTVLLIVAIGIYLTLQTGFAQVRLLPHALRSFLSKFSQRRCSHDGVSPYQALCTALAATVGTGNIAGVAGAIAIGGPGSVFWMWICGLLGMIIKCAEATLAVRYRKKLDTSQIIGGPMYYIEHGLGPKWKWLAVLYAFLGVVAAFGVGNATQINAVIDGLRMAADSTGIPLSRYSEILIAAVLAMVVAWMLSGGAASIGKAAERLVPYASCVYILLGVGLLAARYQTIPHAFGQIMHGAFSPEAVTGGAVGSMFIACKTGASRGVFTNEAGMGTAAIAHAGAKVSHPFEQGMMGIIEVFLDTIVICTVTALVILCSGIEIPYGTDLGAGLTCAAFSQVYGGWVSFLIALCLVCFAFATILGWGYYGLSCAQYLLGKSIKPVFLICQVATVMAGALLKTNLIWLLAESVNGLMAIPNLVALILLSPEFVRQYRSYYLYRKSGCTNENLNQCKSLRAFTHAQVSSIGSESATGRQNHLSPEYWSA